MPRLEREMMVKDLVERMSSAQSILLSSFSGLKVQELSELRKSLKEVGAEYRVAKNTIAHLSMRKGKFEELTKFLDGSTGFTFCYENPMVPLKVLERFARDHTSLGIKGGFVEGKVLGKEDLLLLSSLPTREELLVELSLHLLAPIASIVGLLRGIILSLIQTISLIACPPNTCPPNKGFGRREGFGRRGRKEEKAHGKGEEDH